MTLDVMETSRRFITVFGLGSQGQAWVHALEHSGWNVEIVRRADLEAWAPDLNRTPLVVALLIPDDQIGTVYRDVLAKWGEESILVVLAHGLAVASGQLQLSSDRHEVSLLAPKAIGPKIREAFDQARAQGHSSHSLKAAIQKPKNPNFKNLFQDLVLSLGFSEKNLIETDFATETVGDLLSEQGLLCGGLLAHLVWTSDRMRREGVPDRLIQEECLTELRLIAELLSEKGPVETFKKISPAAKLGAIHFLDRMEKSNVREIFEKQMDEIVSGRFMKCDFRAELSQKESDFVKRLSHFPFGDLS